MRKKVIFSTLLIILSCVAVIGWQKNKQNTLQVAGPEKAAKLAKVKHVNFVALGDSLTEGVGDEKHEQGYSGRIAKEIDTKYDIKVSMSNFGRSGDRSDQIQKRLQTQPDFQHAVEQAGAIIVTVGGNDLQQSLLKNISAKTPTDLSAAIATGQKQYENKLVDLFKVIRSRNSDAPIFIFGNYNPLFVHFPKREDLNKDVQLFNTVNRRVAVNDKNSYYVSLYQLTFGQYNNKKLRQTLNKKVKPISKKTDDNAEMTATLLGETTVKNNWISETDNYHPNNIGYNYMTTQLFNVMRKEQSTWLKAH
ncbi:GDSL-type esterase/lipase family protein [Leuconostoc rapi]|uniref:GDSL-type esterase/lipase family protein n=1 Tax=Leuconostoc rapi TaxID=1406906 RepID=UPI001957EADA|nr:GDSL-type esterase/lipase family protein [Leuconostoc rapi]MBM7435035.1 lysophospholipase L1-like esterase [Leuconostoc rapi]